MLYSFIVLILNANEIKYSYDSKLTWSNKFKIVLNWPGRQGKINKFLENKLFVKPSEAVYPNLLGYTA
jgi:hypothetical protein